MLLEADAVPVAETSLSHYFTARLKRCARGVRRPPQEDTFRYLGSLLDRFGRSEALFSYEEGRRTLRPLAELYGDARETPSERERCLLLQQLGDLALFVGALFPERFARRGIRREYVVGMGGGAYEYLAGNARRNRHVFAELAATFSHMLDLVGRSCARTERLAAEEVLALYQRWVRTRDPLAERQLRTLGIGLDGAGRVH